MSSPEKEEFFTSKEPVQEKLPWKYVHYPPSNGTFFRFSHSLESQPTYCYCAMEAFSNAIQLKSKAAKIWKDLVSSSDLFDVDAFSKGTTPFQRGLCHECNSTKPTILYCHEYYGSKFKQHYGWYINKQMYEFGLMHTFIKGHRYVYDPALVPQEVLCLVESLLDKSRERDALEEAGSKDHRHMRELVNECNRLDRQVSNIIENEVRDKFSYKKIGEHWTSETILYYLVKNLLEPNGLTIRRHFRPSFLEGLELDIYIEEVRIGLEYQGIQHFKPVKHWGGEKALKQTQLRDEKKKRLCAVEGVTLLYVMHDEEISEELLIERLSKFMEI